MTTFHPSLLEKLSLNKSHLIIGLLLIGLATLYFKTAPKTQAGDFKSELDAVLVECQSDPICLKKKITPEKYQNLAAVMDYLEQRVGPQSCHELAHGVAEVVGEMNQDISKTIGSCNEKCGYGCYHGSFLGAVRVRPDLVNNLNSICQPFANSSFPGQKLTACNHGLGHGLAELASYDLVQSTKLCDGLADRRWQDECATGVFMEIIEGSIQGGNRSQLKIPETIADLCQPLSKNYQDICLLNTASYEYKRSGDLPKSFNLCKSIPVNLQDNCIGDMGTDLYFMLNGDSAKIWQGCLLADENKRLTCINGAVFSSLVNDPKGGIGSKICQKASPDNLQQSCQKYLDESVSSIQKKNG